jgi:hypothetical protein
MASFREIAPGLKRWTAVHDEWEEPVGSLALETDDGLVLIDPIDPPPSVRKAEHVLLTVFWHGRSTADVRANHVWAPRRSARMLGNRGIEVTDPFGADVELPGGVRAYATARNGEVVYWLPSQRAVAVGDVLLGAGAKPRASLGPLLDLPVQRVLVSHGEPVLRAGKRALAAVLG